MFIVTVTYSIGGKDIHKGEAKRREHLTFPPLKKKKPLITPFKYYWICLSLIFSHPSSPSYIYSFIFFFFLGRFSPYGCRSSNVKHFALASFCNLQFSNVRPVEGTSDNGRYPLPPLSHHIFLQLMLQRELHVITLALVACPREGGGYRWCGKREKVGRLKKTN